MNKSYRSIWCEKTGTYVAAAETSRARGRKSSASMIGAALVAGLAGCMAVSAATLETPAEANEGTYGKGKPVASGDGATAVGAGSLAQGTSSTALGASSLAFGQNSTAIGILAKGHGTGALAMGWNADVSLLGSYGVALGGNTSVSASYGVAIGYGASASAIGGVAIGVNAVADRDYAVSVGTAARQRQIINLSNGTHDSDAVNLAQLKATANAFGGGAGIDATGTLTPPSYRVAGGVQTNVGAALNALDLYTVQFDGVAGAANLKNRKIVNLGSGAIEPGSTEAVNGGQLFTTNSRVDSAEGDITTIQGDVANLNTQITNGTLGLVKQDAATSAITVASATGGTSVNFAGSSGDRTLSGVAEGALDNDAVNVSQLKKAGVMDSSGQALEVATYDAGSNKGAMTLRGADGTQLKNVADGSADMDAVNIRQLRKAGLVDADGNTLDAVTYDVDSGRSVVTFGGPGTPTVLLSNVRAGAADTDAANVGQLRDVATALGGGASIDVDGNVNAPVYTVNNVSYSNLGDALAALEGSVGKGGPGAESPSDKAGMEGVALGSGSGNGATASGIDSVAIGSGASASGIESVALGANSTATADNSVALGAGSVATRENTVSVGSVGNERAIANVADGVMETDAVNKRQLESVATGAKAYTDARINQVQQAVDNTARTAYSGVAAATALAMIPDVDQGKKFAMGLGVGSFKGYQAAAIGASARLSERLTVKAGVGTSSAGSTVGAGASFQW